MNDTCHICFTEDYDRSNGILMRKTVGNTIQNIWIFSRTISLAFNFGISEPQTKAKV